MTFFLSLIFAFQVSQVLGGRISDVHYFVPVPPELSPYACSPLHHLKLKSSDDQTILSFALPKQLTGTALPMMEFSGPSNTSPLILEGVFGALTCNVEKSKILDCFIRYNEQYKNILAQLDSEVKKAMGHQISDPNELSKRIRVWEVFSGDPLGVVTFSMCPDISQ